MTDLHTDLINLLGRLTHIANPAMEYRVLAVHVGRYGRTIVGEADGEYVSGEPVDVVGRGIVLASVNAYASRTEAEWDARQRAGLTEVEDDDGDGDGQPGFCIYGCTDYHLADCPTRDRGFDEPDYGAADNLDW